ncbi:MAG: hypothetical protein ACR2QK_06175 [Acidimicrobiales bacterium]
MRVIGFGTRRNRRRAIDSGPNVGRPPGRSDRSPGSTGSSDERSTLALAITALMVLPGCGAIAEAVLEEAAEEATGVEIENQDGVISIEGDEVSLVVDTDDANGNGRLTIESSDGSITIDGNAEDGTVDVTTEGFDGEDDQQLTFTTTEAEIPDGFPVPFPDGGIVESGSVFESGGSKLMHVGLQYPSSTVDGLIAYYDDYFAGDDSVAKHDVSSGGERTVGFITNPRGQLTAVTVVDQSDGALLLIETTVELG